MLGAQRSSINPMLQRFQADGLIKLGRLRLTIVDREGLKRRACECYAAVQNQFEGLRADADRPA